MHDWNKNGKQDSFDSFTEHEVFHEVDGSDSSRDWLLWLIPAALLLLRILWR